MTTIDRAGLAGRIDQCIADRVHNTISGIPINEAEWREIVASLRTTTEAGGGKWAPSEPTEEMLSAVWNTGVVNWKNLVENADDAEIAAIYKAMLAATPHPASVAGKPSEEATIPCEVMVAPATRFGRGIKLSTVLEAIERRRGQPEENTIFRRAQPPFDAEKQAGENALRTARKRLQDIADGRAYQPRLHAAAGLSEIDLALLTPAQPHDVDAGSETEGADLSKATDALKGDAEPVQELHTLPAEDGDGLVARMRAYAGWCENGGCTGHSLTDEVALLNEAADALEAKVRRIAELEEALRHA